MEGVDYCFFEAILKWMQLKTCSGLNCNRFLDSLEDENYAQNHIRPTIYFAWLCSGCLSCILIFRLGPDLFVHGYIHLILLHCFCWFDCVCLFCKCVAWDFLWLIYLWSFSGVFSGELSLSDQTPLGTWKIDVQTQVSKTFVLLLGIRT